MSADSLTTALAAIGLPGNVEALGGMAIFTAVDAATFAKVGGHAALRDRATALAMQHGFSVFGLELPPDADIGAIVSGD